MHVALDAVRDAGVRVREDAPVDEEGRLRRGVVQQREGVDGGRAGGVPGGGGGGGSGGGVHGVGVGDVEGALVRGEGDAVRAAEAVGDDADVARGGDEAVDVLGQLGLGAEAVLEAVDGVGEPDGAVGGNDDVVGRVERP